MVKHTKEGIKCDLCPMVFAIPATAKQHMDIVHLKEKRHKCQPLVCELCGKVSASASALAVHRGQHKEYLRYKCDECPKAFVFKGLLENHKRVEHQGERHICSICGRQFKYLAYLKRHSYQHKEEKSFKCDKCPAEFRHPEHFELSQQSQAQAEVFPCTICGKGVLHGLRWPNRRCHSSKFFCTRPHDNSDFSISLCPIGWKSNSYNDSRRVPLATISEPR
nr:zinc finger protein 728-like [Aedes albopictus]